MGWICRSEKEPVLSLSSFLSGLSLWKKSFLECDNNQVEMWDPIRGGVGSEATAGKVVLGLSEELRGRF